MTSIDLPTTDDDPPGVRLDELDVVDLEDATTTTGGLAGHATDASSRAQPRVVAGRWPWAGVGAGVASGLALVVLHAPFIDDEAAYAAGPEAVYALLDGQLATQLGAAAGYLAAALLVPFGLGLVRTLWDRAPSARPLVASLAALLVAAVATITVGMGFKSLLASGLPGHMDNSFYTHVDVAVLHTIASQLMWLVFLPVIASAAVVAVLALRHGALQRWVGVLGALLAGVVTCMTVALNLPYSAGLASPVWLVAVSLAVLRLRSRAA